MRVLVAVLVSGALMLSAPGQSSGSNACTADATKALIQSFVRGYGAGHVRAIDRMFAPEPRFEWFSAGKPASRYGSVAENRATDP